MNYNGFDVSKMSVLEMLGIKSVVDAYNYYSSKSEEEIVKDIREALNGAGIAEDNQNYNEIFEEYRKKALEMKEKASSMTREEFFKDGYEKLKEEFGFGEKEEQKETACKYEDATEEERERIRNESGILKNTFRDLKNFLTAKNNAGKGMLIYLGANVAFGAAISLAGGNITPLAFHVVNGLLPTIPYFFGALGKNIRRKVMPDNAINRMADKVDDFLDEPATKKQDTNDEYSMSDENREFMRRL